MSTSLILSVTIPGDPVGASRPRVVRGGSRTFMPKAHTAWESKAIGLLSRRRLVKPLDQAVKVEIVAVYPRPKSMIPKRFGGAMTGPTENRLASQWGPLVLNRMPAHIGKPDIDNVAKLALDAATKARVLKDDTRVVELHCRKVYAGVARPMSWAEYVALQDGTATDYDRIQWDRLQIHGRPPPQDAPCVELGFCIYTPHATPF